MRNVRRWWKKSSKKREKGGIYLERLLGVVWVITKRAIDRQWLLSLKLNGYFHQHRVTYKHGENRTHARIFPSQIPYQWVQGPQYLPLYRKNYWDALIVTYVIPVQHIECIMIELFGARFVGRVFRGRERRNRMLL